MLLSSRPMIDRDARRFAPERHAAILALLDEEGRLVSTRLADRLDVSVDTVRRDLVELEASGRLRRVHGGAIRPAPGARRFTDRAAEDDGARAIVAELAAGLVPHGAVVAIGGGTTALAVARRVPHDLAATVVTSSPDVALALREHPAVEVDLLGGRLDRVSQTVVGADTVEQLRAVRPDVVLVGSCGVDPEAGVTFREREEARVVRAMVERAARTVVLAAAGKLGTAGPYVAAATEQIDVLVTDAPRGQLAAYEARGVTVLAPGAAAEPPAAVGA